MAGTDIHRHIEGGNADFLAGCVLSSFDLRPNIRVTNKLSIKSDVNTILVSWKSSRVLRLSTVKSMLQCFAGPTRFCHRAPPGLQGSLPFNTIAGFYQPEHARAALKLYNGSDDVEICLVYTVYFTAPKELSDAVLLDIEEIASQTPETIVAWEEPRNGMVTMRLSGTNRGKIVDVKKIFEAIFAGRVATGSLQASRYEIWHDFFATAPGEVWLQHLERETGVIIMSDKLQRRIRIYDPEDDDTHTRYVELKLAERVIGLDAWQENHSIQFETKEFRKLIASDAVAKVQQKLGKANVSLDILKKALVLHCPRQTAWLIAYELNLPLPPPTGSMAHSECPQCGDATTDVRFSTCGHVSCRDCFDHQLQVASSDLTSNHFPLACWHENCAEPITIPDLRKYATGIMIDALLKASLTYHIRSSPDIYRNCRTPDCRSVYLRNGSYEIFTCPTCLTQTCTLCHADPHVGWSCTEYEAHLRKTQLNEHLLDAYKATAGTKECPKCATLIEKVFNKAEAAYQHMNDAHGGNGLVDEEGDDSEFDSEDENDDDGEWEDVDENEVEYHVQRWLW
ncbi:hypothetical protein BKA66DRAFT_562258 [Pyrenochaeta sp. MPI-SDFR-AT-0127]|nr:hypothetical protein BKA66DRAFT_562258 [Pyrenochaeta sp. MPI-SDFR-AT-0127]